MQTGWNPMYVEAAARACRIPVYVDRASPIRGTATGSRKITGTLQNEVQE